MQRALNGAYQRLNGKHPRRAPSFAGRVMEVLCDILLAVAALAFLGGLILIVLSLVGGFQPVRFIAGLALTAAGPALLLLWGRIALEPLTKTLSQLS